MARGLKRIYYQRKAMSWRSPYPSSGYAFSKVSVDEEGMGTALGHFAEVEASHH